MNNNYNNISDDLIKNFDITDQLITNNPSNQNDYIINYINLILSNYTYMNDYGKGGRGGGGGNNVNVYNNYRSDRLVTDTSVKNTSKIERFHDYYSI